jgi:hypothetical protein
MFTKIWTRRSLILEGDKKTVPIEVAITPKDCLIFISDVSMNIDMAQAAMKKT